MRDKGLIKEVNFKHRDLHILCDNMECKLKNQKEETVEIIKDFEKKISEMDKTINTDLNDAYKGNNDLMEVLRKSKEENTKLKRENNKYKRFQKRIPRIPVILHLRMNPKRFQIPERKQDQKKEGQHGHTVHRSTVSKHPHKVIYKTVVKAPKRVVAVFNKQNEIEYYKAQEINAYLKTANDFAAIHTVNQICSL